jgi:flagellar basal-body rod protein FlgG
MSTKGVYSALSGAMAQAQRLDTIANNMANVNTPSFKRDTQTFSEYITANEKPPDVIQVPRIPASIESFYDMQGGDKSFVDSAGTFTDFSQGSLKSTGTPLDVAIDGKGFFEVATPEGVRLTRHGSFSIDGNGQVVTKEGWPVLKAGQPGEAPEQRVIRVQGNQGAITITENGNLYEGENVVAKLGLVEVANKDHLQKVGNSMYDFKKNAQPEVTSVNTPSMKQGFLEMSNVNIVQEMTDMISATRVFESAQKAISAYDQMSDKLVNVVAKTTA